MFPSFRLHPPVQNRTKYTSFHDLLISMLTMHNAIALTFKSKTCSDFNKYYKVLINTNFHISPFLKIEYENEIIADNFFVILKHIEWDGADIVRFLFVSLNVEIDRETGKVNIKIKEEEDLKIARKTI